MNTQENAGQDRGRPPQKMMMNAVILLVAVLLLNAVFNGPGKTTVFRWGETGLAAEARDGSSYTLLYADLITVELTEDWEFGTCVDGGETSKERYGLWNNAQWGDYRLYAVKAAGVYIVMYTEQGVFVMNCESDETTRAVFEVIPDILSGHGYTAQFNKSPTV